MSNCINCGAAMPPRSMVCTYCNTRQDIDLKGIHRYTVHHPESERICPRCDTVMPTIDLKIDGKFLVERCDHCMGLFFDPGELEAMLDKSVDNVYNIDYTRIQDLKDLKRHKDFPVTYIKCPVCRKLMNRVNFGSQSGVIVDKCRNDGIWLDGGELRHLLEWTKAGGQLHHQNVQAEMERLKAEQEKERIRQAAMAGGVGSPGGSGRLDGHFDDFGGGRDVFASAGDFDILKLVSRFVGKLFG